MTNLVAVTIGDINGIGIRILIKAWKKKRIRKFVLFTNHKIFENFLKKEKIIINLNIVNKNLHNFYYRNDKFNIFSYKSNSKVENTFMSLNYAYSECVKNMCIGILTLPLRKDLIINQIDKNFIGHTEYFQKMNKKKYSNMILFHKKIIISPITTHIKVKNISKILEKKDFLLNQIKNLISTLKIDFKIKNPRIAISGLNPHAGESGKIGKEEIRIITPSIKKLRKIGCNIEGPFSADSILIKKNLLKYDCFVFIYHDQALIPFKYISQFSGVNYTGNLSIIRTSPDHGTAYNLIGSKTASDKSLINCYKLIKRIFINRLRYDQSKKIS